MTFQRNKLFGIGALLATASGLQGSPALAQTDTSEIRLEEVVVTASKRTASLQDLNMSVRALDAHEIDVRGIQSMGDYLTSVPSVAFNERGGGRSQITIRGISSGVLAVDPNTVGYYFGEVPVSDMARGNPDLKLFDIERVEILRGPQGTLYGSGSMGGTIKVVPNSARVDEFEGQAEAVLSTTSKGGNNYSGAGSINIPLVDDKLAARLTIYDYENDGFVDNRRRGGGAYGIQDANIADIAAESTSGARLAVKWRVSDRFDLDAMVITQNQTVDGLPEVTPQDGDWAQNRWTDEDLNDDFDVYNMVASYSGDGFDVLASSAYMERDWNQTRDVHTLGVLSFQPDAPLALFDGNQEEQWVHEVRVSSNSDSKLQWLVGAFYLQKDLDFDNNLYWYGSQASIEQSLLYSLFGANAGDPLHSRANTHDASQQALFGEVSYQLTPELKATAGLRWFEFEDKRELSVFGIFSNSVDKLYTSDSTTNPKVALDYTPSDDELYYASATKGFRPGSPNNPLPDVCDADLSNIGFARAPDGTEPDSLWSYEVGTKLSLANGRVNLNGAVYYVDWKDIPASVILPCGFSFGFNADTATSQGVELEVSAQISDNFRVDAGGSYTDAELDPSRDPATGDIRNPGGDTPGVPDLTLSLGAEYEFQLADRYNSGLRLDAQYVGGYYNFLPSETGRRESGDYTTVNLRWRTEFGNLSGEIFANNLLDETVEIVADTEMPDGRIYMGRPRTVGARINYRF
ncbi:MAG TPA: hypothetical protein DD459_00935 [Halieaceae bacterium]|nr:hypothetical protein [Halieaceae bacterium]|tara:strand:- start:4416 stop:6650 length:2235 start_codon:yes stop_codon:yes gene_type:complete